MLLIAPVPPVIRQVGYPRFISIYRCAHTVAHRNSRPVPLSMLPFAAFTIRREFRFNIDLDTLTCTGRRPNDRCDFRGRIRTRTGFELVPTTMHGGSWHHLQTP